MQSGDLVQRLPPPEGLPTLAKGDVYGAYLWLRGCLAMAQGVGHGAEVSMDDIDALRDSKTCFMALVKMLGTAQVSAVLLA